MGLFVTLMAFAILLLYSFGSADYQTTVVILLFLAIGSINMSDSRE